MNNTDVVTAELMDENTLMISFTEVIYQYHIPEELLIELLEHGLFNEITLPIKQLTFNPPMLKRIQSAQRLQDDLNINSPGVVLVLELHDELEALRRELDILRRYIGS